MIELINPQIYLLIVFTSADYTIMWHNNLSKNIESYKGFVALVRRMNKYKREAMAAFANPSNAKRKVDLAEVFAKIGEIGESLQGDK